MLISGVTIVRNAIRLGYPFEQSIRSLLPLVDELVVAVGDSDDGTWDAVQAIGDAKIRAFQTRWDLSPRGAGVLAVQTNLALERCRGDWAVYLQADEVLHEDDVEVVHLALNRHHFRSTEALTFEYRNFLESFDLLATDWRYWSPRAVRAIRTGIGIRSTGDAAGFRLRRNGYDRGLITARSGGRVFHYGWCLGPVLVEEKLRNLATLYEGVAVDRAPQPHGATRGRPGRLERFGETHPAVMRPRVQGQSWSASATTLAHLQRCWRPRIPFHSEHLPRLVRYLVPAPVRNIAWRASDAVWGAGMRPQRTAAAAAVRRFLREHRTADTAARVSREFLRASARALHRARLPRGERRKDVLTLSTLANHQFGNQFFQYMFLRTYTARHGLRYECTEWMGEHLYGHQPVRITRRFPEVVEIRQERDDAVLWPAMREPLRNVDVRGYFQYHTTYYAERREEIRALATPVGRYAEAGERQWQRLLERGRTVVALHLRRRYDGAGFFFVTPSSWYRPWLEHIWPQLEEPVLFLASDAPERVRADFAEYRPVVGGDLGPPLEDFPFFLDFDLLTRCHRLAISNSSFSFAAAMLNTTATEFMRPVLPLQRLIAFDPWSANPVLQDALVEDYPHVPGISGRVLGA